MLLQGRIPTQISQAVMILDNSFNTCPIGLELVYLVNNAVVSGNTFDLNEDCGLNCINGFRMLIIEDNFFEACGKVPNRTVGGAI